MILFLGTFERLLTIIPVLGRSVLILNRPASVEILILPLIQHLEVEDLDGFILYLTLIHTKVNYKL